MRLSVRERALMLALWCCATSPRALAAAVTVDDAEHGFRFTTPAGYADYPEGRGPGVLHVFAHGKPDEPSFSLIRIHALGGTIDRSPIIKETVERAAHESVRGTGVELLRFDYRKIAWKGFELDEVVSFIDAGGDRKLLTMTTQVPLRKQALQLVILGPAAEEARVGADLRALLGSIEGKSNWLSDYERGEKLGRLVGFAVVALGALVFIVFMIRRRRAQA